MKKKATVFIADDNDELRGMIAVFVDKQSDMVVIGEACDGMEAYEKIKKLKPDIAIIDGVMPKLDGLGILEKLNTAATLEPACILISEITTERIVRKSIELGAMYHIFKPFDLEILLIRIRQILRRSTMTDEKKEALLRDNKTLRLESKMSDLLYGIGVPANVVGYYYIREALIIAVYDIEAIKGKKMKIYESIAKLHDTAPLCVERGIYNAISSTFRRGTRNEKLNEMFDTSIYKRKRPNNGEFIALIAEKLRFELKYN
jgi:two-component system response regulator (stage 0 sporulation protein A)